MRKLSQYKGKKGTAIKSIAMSVAVLFLFTDILFFPSQALGQIPTSPIVQGGESLAGFQSQPLYEDGWLPPELGSINEVYRAPGNGEQAAGSGKDESDNASGQRSSLTIPRSDRVMVFIQDAHDSLEGQENIAKIIRLLTERYGVATVFQEGYEGPVPTDDLFGFIEDPVLKEKISYFFLDKLRLRGAEYAHINRQSGLTHGRQSTDLSQVAHSISGARTTDRGLDWTLIGADSLKLHRENIGQYRLSAEKKETIERDLGTIEKELKLLVTRRFPKRFREWMKVKEQFDAKKLDLFTYLERTLPLLSHVERQAMDEKQADPNANHLPPTVDAATPLLQFILEAVSSNSAAVLEKAKHIDAREVFAELLKLERMIAETCLADKGRTRHSGARSGMADLNADLQLYHHYQTIQLLKRLNNLEVTQEEYAALLVRHPSSGVRRDELLTRAPHHLEVSTQRLAEFIHSQTKKPLVLSKQWERNIQDAVKFYEIALQRDDALSAALGEYFQDDQRAQHSQWSGVAPAILVYGGFHKENIKRILEAKGISYVVVSPRITRSSPRHEAYYKQLMTEGFHKFELPFLLHTAASQPTLLNLDPRVARAEIRAVYEAAIRYPDYLETWDRHLNSTGPGNIASEMSPGGENLQEVDRRSEVRGEVDGKKRNSNSQMSWRSFLKMGLLFFATGWFSMAHTGIAQPSVKRAIFQQPSSVEWTIFRQGNWTVLGARDTGPASAKIRTSAGSPSEIKIVNGRHQIFSVKGNGFLRGTLPGMDWGTSFVLPGYWSQGRYFHNPRITRASFDLNEKGELRLKGAFEDQNGNFVADDFEIVFSMAPQGEATMKVSFTVKAKKDFTLDPERLRNHDGFRIAQFSSMNVGTEHDADMAEYEDKTGERHEIKLENKNQFIFHNPRPFGSERTFYLKNKNPVHGRNNPTTSIRLAESMDPSQFTPQGWITKSKDVNDDNVGGWIHFDAAETGYRRGETIGRFEFVLGIAPNRSETRTQAGKMDEGDSALTVNRIQWQETTQPPTLAETHSGMKAVTPKNTSRDRHGYFLNQLFRALFFQKVLGLDFSQGEHRIVDVGVGALPVTTVEMAERFQEEIPGAISTGRIEMIGIEIPEAVPYAHITAEGLVEKFGFQCSVRPVEEFFRRWDLKAITLTVNEKKEVTGAFVSFDTENGTHYRDIAVRQGTFYLNLGRSYDGWQGGLLDEMIEFLGPEKIRYTLSQGVTGTFDGISVELDPVRNMLEKAGVRLVVTDDPWSAGVRDVRLMTVFNVIQHIPQGERLPFLEKLAQSLKKGKADEDGKLIEMGGILAVKGGRPDGTPSFSEVYYTNVNGKLFEIGATRLDFNHAVMSGQKLEGFLVDLEARKLEPVWIPADGADTSRSEIRAQQESRDKGEFITSLANASLQLARHLHDNKFHAVLASGDSAEIPLRLVTTAWQTLYPDEPFPLQFVFDGQENNRLYRDWAAVRAFGADRPEDQKRFWEQAKNLINGKGSLDGERQLIDLKEEKLVFIDTLMSTGFKTGMLKMIFGNLGFKNISYAILWASDLQILRVLHPDVFVAEPNRGKIDELEDLDHDLSILRKNEPELVKLTMEEIQETLALVQNAITGRGLSLRSKIRSSPSDHPEGVLQTENQEGPQTGSDTLQISKNPDFPEIFDQVKMLLKSYKSSGRYFGDANIRSLLTIILDSRISDSVKRDKMRECLSSLLKPARQAYEQGKLERAGQLLEVILSVNDKARSGASDPLLLELFKDAEEIGSNIQKIKTWLARRVIADNEGTRVIRPKDLPVMLREWEAFSQKEREIIQRAYANGEELNWIEKWIEKTHNILIKSVRRRSRKINNLQRFIVQGRTSLKKKPLAMAGMIVVNFIVDIFFIHPVLKVATIAGAIWLIKVVGMGALQVVIAVGSAALLLIEGGLVRLFIIYPLFKLGYPKLLRINLKGLIVNFVPSGPGNFAPFLFFNHDLGIDMPLALKERYLLSGQVERMLAYYPGIAEEIIVDITEAIYQAQLKFGDSFNYRRFKIRRVEEEYIREGEESKDQLISYIKREDLSSHFPFRVKLKDRFFRWVGFPAQGYHKGTRPTLFIGDSRQLKKIKQLLKNDGLSEKQLEGIFQLDLTKYFQKISVSRKTVFLRKRPLAGEFIQPMFPPPKKNTHRSPKGKSKKPAQNHKGLESVRSGGDKKNRSELRQTSHQENQVPDVTWEELEQQGYGLDFNREQVKGKNFYKWVGGLKKDGRIIKGSSFTLQVFPRYRLLCIESFFPAFPINDMNGKGRALLRKLLTFEDYTGFSVVSFATGKFPASLAKMKELHPVVDLTEAPWPVLLTESSDPEIRRKIESLYDRMIGIHAPFAERKEVLGALDEATFIGEVTASFYGLPAAREETQGRSVPRNSVESFDALSDRERMQVIIDAMKEFWHVGALAGNTIREPSPSNIQMIEDLVRHFDIGTGRKKILETTGFGDGLTAAILAVATDADVVGIEPDPARFKIGKAFLEFLEFKGIELPNLRLLQENLLDHEINDYDLIYFDYTPPVGGRESFPQKVLTKMEKSLKAGSVFVAPRLGSEDPSSILDVETRIVRKFTAGSGLLAHRYDRLGKISTSVFWKKESMNWGEVPGRSEVRSDIETADRDFARQFRKLDSARDEDSKVLMAVREVMNQLPVFGKSETGPFGISRADKMILMNSDTDLGTFQKQVSRYFAEDENSRLRYPEMMSWIRDRLDSAREEEAQTRRFSMESSHEERGVTDRAGELSGSPLSDPQGVVFSENDLQEKMNMLFSKAGVYRRNMRGLITRKGIYFPSALDTVINVLKTMDLDRRKHAVILDAGHGQGEFVFYLAKLIQSWYPDLEVELIGIEFEDEIFDESMRLLEVFKREGLSEKISIRFHQGDFNSKDFEPYFQKADYVYYFSKGTNDIRSFARTLAETMNKPGAKIVEYGDGDLAEYMQLGHAPVQSRMSPVSPRILVHEFISGQRGQRSESRSEQQGKGSGIFLQTRRVEYSDGKYRLRNRNQSFSQWRGLARSVLRILETEFDNLVNSDISADREKEVKQILQNTLYGLAPDVRQIVFSRNREIRRRLNALRNALASNNREVFLRVVRGLNQLRWLQEPELLSTVQLFRGLRDISENKWHVVGSPQRMNGYLDQLEARLQRADDLGRLFQRFVLKYAELRSGKRFLSHEEAQKEAFEATVTQGDFDFTRQSDNRTLLLFYQLIFVSSRQHPEFLESISRIAGQQAFRGPGRIPDEAPELATGIPNDLWMPQVVREALLKFEPLRLRSELRQSNSDFDTKENIAELEKPAVFVIEKEQFERMSPGELRQMMVFAAINRKNLWLVIPDMLEGGNGQFLEDLKSLGVRISRNLPEIAKSSGARVIGFSDRETDTAGKLRMRLEQKDPRLAKGVKEYFAFEGGNGFFLAQLVSQPEDLAVMNGFRYDRTGRFQAALNAFLNHLMNSYVVTAISA